MPDIDALDPNDISQSEFLGSNLEEEAFTAVPSAENAARVHAANRRLLKMSILFCLDAAGDGLGEDISAIRQRYRELDTAQTFAPALYADQTRLVDAMRSQNVLTVCDAVNELRVLSDEEIFDSAFRTESILTERWEQNVIAKVRAQQVEGMEDNTASIRPILDQDIDVWLNGFSEARDILEQTDADVLAEIDEYVTRLKLFRGDGCFAFTSPEMFGAIYLRAPRENESFEYFLEHLVHETAHLALNGLMLHDPLLENPTDVHEAPIRPDPRPLFQVLHATFVLSRTVRVFRKVIGIRPEPQVKDLLTQFEQQYADGYQTIAKVAQLTQRGRKLVESMEPVKGDLSD